MTVPTYRLQTAAAALPVTAHVSPTILAPPSNGGTFFSNIERSENV